MYTYINMYVYIEMREVEKEMQIRKQSIQSIN
jgi:hypothetical protein